MKVSTTSKAQARIDVGYLSRFNMQTYSKNNLYPQTIRDITNESPTAIGCLNRYAEFIEGNGFESDETTDFIVSKYGDTLDDLLHNIAQDLARYNGFALHVSYNAFCEVNSIEYVPFEQCRLAEKDDAGHVTEILVHPDWSGRSTRSGKTLKIDENSIRRYYIYNPSKEVVSKEMAKDGDALSFRGQIAWFSRDGKYTYPKPVYDAAITDISTDAGLSNVMYRNARTSFLAACMLVTKKGTPAIDYAPDMTDDERVNAEMFGGGSFFSGDDLDAFQGDENTGKILAVELESSEDMPEIKEFPTKNFDKDFSVTEPTITRRIHAIFNQDLFYTIQMGKLGFSGQVMKDAYEYYAGKVRNEQRFIMRGLKSILNHFTGGFNYPLDIMPQSYISSEKVAQEEQDAAPNNI